MSGACGFKINNGCSMTKKELIDALANIGDDEVVICADKFGCWDNIDKIDRINGTPAIVFGGGSPFSDE